MENRLNRLRSGKIRMNPFVPELMGSFKITAKIINMRFSYPLLDSHSMASSIKAQTDLCTEPYRDFVLLLALS